MLRLLLLTVFALSSVCGDGDLIILHSPKSLEFRGMNRIDQSQLKEVFSAALGYTVKYTKPELWHGEFIADPFNLPEALVSIAIEGVESIESSRGIRFPLVVDEVEETTWQAVNRRLEERDSNNTLVRIHVGDGLNALGHSVLGELKPNESDQSSLEFLDLKNEEDSRFMGEIQLLRAIANKIRATITANSKPDVYWLVVSGLRPVMDLHGNDSPATKEALSLLNDALSDVSKAFMDVYNDRVLIAAFTNDANKVRNTRSVEEMRIKRQADKANENGVTSENPSDATKVSSGPVKNEETEEEKINVEEAEESNGNDEIVDDEANAEIVKSTSETTYTSESPGRELNNRFHEVHAMTGDDENTNKPVKLEDILPTLAKKYNSNYPAIFNIILWFGVVFLFSLIAICIAIADMDPGRDSIIYRMTSNRMKKDN